MKTLGAAKISIIADASGMSKGIRQAKQQVGVLSNTLTSASKMVTGFAAAYAGMKGISALTSQMEEIDKVAKTSRKLGMMTEELIGLRHAAEQSGVAVATFDMAMQRMTRRVGEASHGTGEGLGAIRELGLDPKQLAAAGPSAALDAIADKMANVESASDRLRIAFKLFDSEGVALVNMLDKGSGGLDAYKKDAERLGLTYSAQDAARVEAANDAIDRFKKSIESIATDLIIVLAPTIQSVADTITDTVTKLRELGIVGGEKEGESRGNMSYAVESVWQFQKALLTLPGDTAKAFMDGKLDLMDIKSGIGIDNEALNRLSDIFSGKAMVDDDSAAARKAQIKEDVFGRSKEMAMYADAEKQLYDIQSQIDAIRLGEEAYFKLQKESLGWTSEMIEEHLAKQRELINLKNQEAEATKKAAEAEEMKQKALADQKAILQEQRDFARSIFEEGQTEYERGIMRQKEIMDAYNRGDIDGRDASMALKANTSGVMDSMRSKAQGESTVTESYTKGSAAAYNAIVNALGQKDKQAEIAQNTKLLYAEAQKSSRSLAELVAKRESYNAEVTVEEI